jgi:DNA-binding NarL/FixJ family response regulator
VDMVWTPPERKQFGNLVLADEHTLVAEGIAKLLEDSFSRVSIASTADRFREVVRNVRPSLVITDLYLPGSGCIELMEGILQEQRAPAFMFLPAEADPDTVARAMAAGAKGFLHRRCGSQELFRAIDCVMGGCTYVAASLLANHQAATGLGARGLGHEGAGGRAKASPFHPDCGIAQARDHAPTRCEQFFGNGAGSTG